MDAESLDNLCPKVEVRETSNLILCWSAIGSDDDDDEDGDLNSFGPAASERDDHDLSKKDVRRNSHHGVAREPRPHL